MSDELELDYEDEVVGETSSGETSTTDPVPTGRQPQAVPNLDDDPRFRAYQSNADRRISNAEYLAQQAQREAATLKQQMQQVYMQGMDETQRYQYMLQLKDEELQQERRARELDAFAQQRQRDLQEISRKTGAPVELLANARDTYEAWTIAYEHKERSGMKQQKPALDEPAQQVDDRVNVGGGGKPLSQAQRLQREFSKALDDYDVNAQFKLMDQAMLAGVTLKDKSGRAI